MNHKQLNRRRFLRYSAAASAGVALSGCAQMGPGGMEGSMPAAGGSMRSAIPIPSLTDRQGEYAEVNGARIFYQSVGQGEPLLLLHGYPLSGALFARNRDALAQRYRVITLDHRGYGMSTAPGVPDNVAIYAQDALAVMTQLGVQQAIIGGHSMGGPIVFEMYRRAPERFRGMILIDTIAAPASAIEKGLWMGFVEYVRQNGIDQGYVNALIKDMLSGDTRVNVPEQVNFLSAVVQQASRDGAIGGAMALANRPDSTQLLAGIQVPTLVFVGVEDTIYPVAISQMMQQAIPNSTLATIPGAAHAAVFEAPERTNQAVLEWAAGIG